MLVTDEQVKAAVDAWIPVFKAARGEDYGSYDRPYTEQQKELIRAAFPIGSLAVSVYPFIKRDSNNGYGISQRRDDHPVAWTVEKYTEGSSRYAMFIHVKEHPGSSHYAGWIAPLYFSRSYLVHHTISSVILGGTSQSACVNTLRTLNDCLKDADNVS